MPLNAAWDSVQNITGGRGVQMLQRGFGSYDPETDPMYWQDIERAEISQTPEAQRAVWDQYQEWLPYETFDEFTQAAFTGAEGTDRSTQEHIRDQEVRLFDRDVEFQLGRGADVRDAEADLFLDHGVEFAIDEMDYAREGWEREGELHERQLEEIDLGLEMTRDQYDEWLQTQPARVGMEYLQYSMAQNDMERSNMLLEALPQQIQNELDQQGLSLKGQELNNESLRLQNELQENLNPLQIQQMESSIEQLDQQIRHSAALHPHEKELLIMQKELMEAQIAHQKAQTSQVGLDRTSGTGPGMGIGPDGEPRQMNEWDTYLGIALHQGRIPTMDDLEQQGFSQPEATEIIDFFRNYNINSWEDVPTDEDGWILDISRGGYWINPYTGEPAQIRQQGWDEGMYEEIMANLNLDDLDTSPTYKEGEYPLQSSVRFGEGHSDRRLTYQEKRAAASDFVDDLASDVSSVGSNPQSAYNYLGNYTAEELDNVAELYGMTGAELYQTLEDMAAGN